MSARKVLLSGDPEGKLGALFKRVAAVNKSNGPFDMLLCVGAFFTPGEEDAEADTELAAYLTGAQSVPISTYFIGSFGQGSRRAMSALAASGAEVNITYLGRSGVVRLKGLSVAFLDGTYSSVAYRSVSPAGDELEGCRHYTEADVKRLKDAAERADGDIDILLTCEWPEGVTAGAAPLPEGANRTSDDPLAAELAVAIRPRYHMAGGKGVFYARAPYMNKDLGAGAHATRFIGLAPVGNPNKQKSLHALGLAPAVDMDRKALTTRPDGASESPYGGGRPGGKRPLEGEDSELGAQSWRWQDNKKARQSAAPSMGRPGVLKDDRKTIYVKNLPFRATEEELDSFFSQAGKVVDVRRGTTAEGKLSGFGHIQFDTEEAVQRALKLHGADLMGRELYVDAAVNKPADAIGQSGKPVDGCWFCLSNPNADVNLLASIGEESYLAVDKGAINWGHVLVLPIEHHRCGLALPPATHAEMMRFLSALRTCYAAKGLELVAFERFMTFRKSGGNHCHINVLPIPAAAAASAKQAFEKEAAAHGLQMLALPVATGEEARTALRDVVGDGEYFHVYLPDSSQLAHAISRGERFPLNFGREVVARLAGQPERADWKNCAAGAAEEEERTAKFKEDFKAWDPM